MAGRSKKTQKEAPRPPSMKELSGPFDPFKGKRELYFESGQLMMQVCGWIARAWREADAIKIVGVDESEWLAWKVKYPDELKTAMVLGQALVFSEIRGVALGITGRRGQAASQKLLLEMLGAKEPPKEKKSEAEKARGDLSPRNQANAMKHFETNELRDMANFDDDPDDLEGRAS